MNERSLVAQIRRRLAARGISTASAHPPGVDGRPDEFRLVRSRLVEGTRLLTRVVGAPTPCPHPVAFLDGVQRYEPLGSIGVTPIVFAEIAAAIRFREDGAFRTVSRASRRLVVAVPGALDALNGSLDGCEPCPIETDSETSVHPLRLMELARQVIDRERGRLERLVGLEFRRQSDAWVIVDGVLTDSDVWARDLRAIGVSKSHGVLPFEGEELRTYLQLESGRRTTLFEPATWRITPVHSWGLRLWPWEGQHLLHGLVRIEVAAGSCSTDVADELSRWVLAERLPLARPDPRWDRLLYGIAAVERHLTASA